MFAQPHWLPELYKQITNSLNPLIDLKNIRPNYHLNGLLYIWILKLQQENNHGRLLI